MKCFFTKPMLNPVNLAASRARVTVLNGIKQNQSILKPVIKIVIHLHASFIFPGIRAIRDFSSAQMTFILDPPSNLSAIANISFLCFLGNGGLMYSSEGSSFLYTASKTLDLIQPFVLLSLYYKFSFLENASEDLEKKSVLGSF